MTFDLKLTGYVGDSDFCSKSVMPVLEEKEGQEVCVLIDSLGGALSEGLSIRGHFARHGNVTAHLASLVASAATIAAMGAKHISMDRHALFLVHRVMLPVFEWDNFNSEDCNKLIEKLKKQADELNKLDMDVAALYAARCKKSPEELYGLMKKGGWLTAEETLSWGFIDEITDYEEDEEPTIDETQALAMAEAGDPLPPVSAMKKGLLTKIAERIIQNGCKGKGYVPGAVEKALEANVTALKVEIASLKGEISTLQNRLEAVMGAEPEDEAADVVETSGTCAPKEKTPLEAYLSVNARAAEIFNNLP